jgi:transposase InsO family protein
VTATPSTVTSSSAAFGRWAFGIGQPHRDTPWQNGYCERAIGSIRRDCLDHVVVFGEWHLRHLLRSYATYYNEARTHLSVNKDAPSPRTVHSVGRILPTPFLGGLHHLYVRV